MITHEDIENLRLRLKGKPTKEAMEEIYQCLHRKVDQVEITPDPEELLIFVQCHIGGPRQMVSCCNGMDDMIRRKRIIYHTGEHKLKIKMIDMYINVFYCPFCGIKTHVK
jgi:hypothetical protein